MKTIKRHKKLILFSSLLRAAVWAGTLTAGDLNPSEPPSSTMKTLNKIEPRTELKFIPAPIGADYRILISQPGSYYLAENITSNFRHAIKSTSGWVTLDLMGFRLYSSWAPPTMENQNFDGIYIDPGCEDIEIRNGTIESDSRLVEQTQYRGFRYGINASTGDTESPANIRVLNITVIASRQTGIYLAGQNHRVVDCVSKANLLNGIVVGNRSTVTGTTAAYNGMGASSAVCGIDAGYYNTVTNCVVNNNGTSAGAAVKGIKIGGGSLVNGCVVTDNGEGTANSVSGIDASSGCILSENSVAGNGDDAPENSTVYGIQAGTESTVTNNSVMDNGYSADNVFGIRADIGSVVSGNSAARNGSGAVGHIYGIFANSGCTVKGNTAHSNGSGENCCGIYAYLYCLVDQNTSYEHYGGINLSTHTGCVLGINVAP